jgi:hypothetical protein
MLCKNTICGAKVRPFYEVAKDFTEKLTQHDSTCLLARGYHPQKTAIASNRTDLQPGRHKFIDSATTYANERGCAHWTQPLDHIYKYIRYSLTGWGSP